MFSEVDLAAQASLRAAFDPRGLANPGKVLPSPAGCGDLRVAAAVAEGAWI
jgi:glycolate oxidase